jgi:hypothetical protein
MDRVDMETRLARKVFVGSAQIARPEIARSQKMRAADREVGRLARSRAGWSGTARAVTWIPAAGRSMEPIIFLFILAGASVGCVSQAKFEDLKELFLHRLQSR